MQLQGKVALVTGAGSGLGRATATLFAQEGAKVAVVDVAELNGQETVSMIHANGGEALFLKADVAKSKDVEEAILGTVANFGGLNILFNNAGISGGASRSSVSIDLLPEESWDQVLAVNLKGVYLCSKFGVPEIKKTGGGAIVNTASISGLVAVGGHAYCASKAAVVHLTRTMAIELAKDNIRVNAVAPGFIDTPMTRGVGERLIAQLVEQVPAGRIGKPIDIAQAVLYLSSDQASLVTGHTLVVDGGYVIQ